MVDRVIGLATYSPVNRLTWYSDGAMVTICLPENSNAVEIIMNGIDLNSVADISFQLKWESHDGSHLECLAARGVNLWRDWLPESVRRALMGRRSWEQASAHFKPGDVVERDAAKRLNVFTPKAASMAYRAFSLKTFSRFAASRSTTVAWALR